jgi:hypothetical protein
MSGWERAARPHEPVGALAPFVRIDFEMNGGVKENTATDGKKRYLPVVLHRELLKPITTFKRKTMSFSSVNVHAVWTTKYREPLLKEPFRSLLFDHMRETA